MKLLWKKITVLQSLGRYFWSWSFCQCQSCQKLERKATNRHIREPWEKIYLACLLHKWQLIIHQNTFTHREQICHVANHFTNRLSSTFGFYSGISYTTMSGELGWRFIPSHSGPEYFITTYLLLWVRGSQTGAGLISLHLAALVITATALVAVRTHTFCQHVIFFDYGFLAPSQGNWVDTVNFFPFKQP